MKEARVKPERAKSRTRIRVPRARIADFCRRWKIVEMSLFGSVLRGDFGLHSDVDVLVTFAPDARWTLLDLIHMEDELKAVFGRDVDLVERKNVERSENYIRRRHILREAEAVYVA